MEPMEAFDAWAAEVRFAERSRAQNDMLELQEG